MVLKSQVWHKQLMWYLKKLLKKSHCQTLGNLRGSQDLPRLQGKDAALQAPRAGQPGQDRRWTSPQILSGLYFPFSGNWVWGRCGGALLQGLLPPRNCRGLGHAPLPGPSFFPYPNQRTLEKLETKTRRNVSHHDGVWPTGLKGKYHLTTIFFNCIKEMLITDK